MGKKFLQKKNFCQKKMVRIFLSLPFHMIIKKGFPDDQVMGHFIGECLGVMLHDEMNNLGCYATSDALCYITRRIIRDRYQTCLCNHDLSVVHSWRRWHQHFCTALPVTGLQTETSYLV